MRRLRRQLALYCPQVGVSGTSIWQYGVNDYASLAKLVKLNQIRREQMLGVVRGGLLEVLFEIIQREELLRYHHQAHLTYTYTPEGTLYPSPLIFIPPDQAWRQAQQAWEAWKQAGLEDCSPNLAPVLLKPTALQTSPQVYRSLTALINGQQTLRDLSLQLKQDPALLTQSIIPYMRRGVMQLVEVQNLNHLGKKPSTVLAQSAVASPPPPEPTTAPSVAYIDDSPRDGQMMGQIVIKAGYRYINLQDAVMALPTLLEEKPSLIFLDLVMPIANGYEICSQIRRTSLFKETPIIIVTNSDGIVDRVRAKIVRSTDFLAKPISEKKVLTILRQYLAVSLTPWQSGKLNGI